MMKRFDMGLSLAVCFATALDGVACAQEGRFHYTGQGAISCEVFGALRGVGPGPAIEDRLLDWAEGYASGINAARPKGYFDLKAKEPDEMKLYLRRYCETHPKALYSVAVWEYVHSLPLLTELPPDESFPKR
jgi:hypothetical protein